MAKNDFYCEYLSQRTEITPEIRKEAHEYATKESMEKSSLIDFFISTATAGIGVYFALGSNKKKEE